LIHGKICNRRVIGVSSKCWASGGRRPARKALPAFAALSLDAPIVISIRLPEQ